MFVFKGFSPRSQPVCMMQKEQTDSPSFTVWQHIPWIKWPVFFHFYAHPDTHAWLYPASSSMSLNNMKRLHVTVGLRLRCTMLKLRVTVCKHNSDKVREKYVAAQRRHLLLTCWLQLITFHLLVLLSLTTQSTLIPVHAANVPLHHAFKITTRRTAVGRVIRMQQTEKTARGEPNSRRL